MYISQKTLSHTHTHITNNTFKRTSFHIALQRTFYYERVPLLHLICRCFILRSNFFCFLSSTSGCSSLLWLNHGWITDRHSIQMARAGASANRNQNQFDVNDNSCVPVVRIIKSLTFLGSWKKHKKIGVSALEEQKECADEEEWLQ